MSVRSLFDSSTLGSIELANRAVMAPMTRSRALDNVPNALMAEYYGQRAGAGLIVTEGTSPSPNGLGYPRIPGVYSDEQVEGWKAVTDAIHAKGGKAFMQIMHTGRVAHPANLPEGAEVIAPSVVALETTEMWVDAEMKAVSMPAPRAMTTDEVESTIEEYVTAAKNAIAAGFDGIELHGANGYLIEQFLSPHTNQRDDTWGGDVDHRLKFAIEVARRCADAIGAERVGIRLSPFGVFNEMPPYDAIDETYTKLAAALKDIGLVYVHLVDHSAMGAPEVPESTKVAIAEAFGGTIIRAGGYDLEKAQTDVAESKADLIAFARPFISNPDLVERFERKAEITDPDPSTFYTADAKGYTDYPTVG